MVNILYLHGFNSSPLSDKAVKTQQYIAKHFPDVKFHCPQLASSPEGAIAQAVNLIEQRIEQQWCLIGSSLGGYFATFLSEKYGFDAVLINPAVKPFELMNDYLGEQLNPYTQEVYQVEKSYISDLIALEQKKLAKNNYLVMVQTGDEVLDYQQAVEKYQQCKLIVQPGGDHSFVEFDNMLPDIVNFFQLQ